MSVSEGAQYDEEFYNAIVDASRSSASRVLPIIADVISPRSVVDVGCGTGEWLRSMHSLTGCEVLGVDGDHVPRDALAIPHHCFVSADLSQPLVLGRTFDLALSLEVAEHLPEGRAASFVADLTGLAPAVLFCAAVPGQGGVGHVNERWQSYWVALFAEHGFVAQDLIRPAVWECDDVAFFYRQNMFLFVDQGALGCSLSAPDLVDVVHPELLRQVASRDTTLTLRELLARMPTAVRRSVKHRLSRSLRRPVHGR